VLRSAESLTVAAGALERLHTAAVEAYDRDGKSAEPCVETWEATNLSLVARVLVAAARRREETRGCHWREDRPDRDDDRWRRHLVVRLTPYRTLDLRTTEGPDFPLTRPAGIGDDGAGRRHGPGTDAPAGPRQSAPAGAHPSTPHGTPDGAHHGTRDSAYPSTQDSAAASKELS
jgi:L-aspartate oxidase